MTLDEYGARLGKILGAANVEGLDPPADLDELVGACHRLGLDLVAAAGILLPRFGADGVEDLDEAERIMEADDAKPFELQAVDGTGLIADEPLWWKRVSTRAEGYRYAKDYGAGDYRLGPTRGEPDELIRIGSDGLVHILGPSRRWRTVEP